MHSSSAISLLAPSVLPFASCCILRPYERYHNWIGGEALACKCAIFVDGSGEGRVLDGLAGEEGIAHLSAKSPGSLYTRKELRKIKSMSCFKILSYRTLYFFVQERTRVLRFLMARMSGATTIITIVGPYSQGASKHEGSIPIRVA